MENIHTILANLGITVPEDKKADFDKTFAENYKTVADHNKVVAARDGYKSQLETAQNSLKEFEGVDVNDLKNKISSLTRDLDTQKAQHEQQIADIEFSNALDSAISGMRGKSAKAVKALLDIDALKASKNQEADIKAALDNLKKESSYLFEDENTPPFYAAGTGTAGMSGNYSPEDAALRSAFGLDTQNKQ